MWEKALAKYGVSDDFINLFRNQKISRTNYLELLLGEFLAESVENKNEMSGIE